MIDFSACRVIPGRAYSGANGSKIAVEYDGAVYMLKFPPSGKGKPTELSYTNSCISKPPICVNTGQRQPENAVESALCIFFQKERRDPQPSISS